MSVLTRLILLVATFVILLTSYFVYQRMTANDLELLLANEEPFGIRLAIVDKDPQEDSEFLAGLAQVVVYPERRMAALYFVNTEAHFDAEGKPLRDMSAGSADRFSEFTDVSTEYYVTLGRTEAVRLFDVLEGMTLIIEEDEEYPDAGFHYRRGVRFFPGAQIVEHALIRKPEEDRSKAYLAGIKQTYRLQSALLNAFWRLDEYRDILAAGPLAKFAASLPSTNLTVTEFTSLFTFLSPAEGGRITVLDVPLEFAPLDRRVYPPQQKLLVNFKRARLLFSEFNENLTAGRLDTDLFPIEVLNGTEVGGLARRVKQFLQDRGLQVLDADNYPHKPLAKTFIVGRSGDTFVTERLMKLTALERRRVVFRRAALDVDASLILGGDFDVRQLRLP